MTRTEFQALAAAASVPALPRAFPTPPAAAGFIVTARTAAASHRYAATGALAALLDAAYDDGALGVTAMVHA